MAPYLLLCLLAICGVHIGQVHAQRECYKCDFKIFNQCMFTNSRSVQCIDDSYSCGRMRFLLGNQQVFERFACFQAAECNRSSPVTGVLNVFQFNSTCCSTSFCNGAFTAQAPHLLFLATLSVFILHIIS